MSDARLLPENHRPECQFRKDAALAAQATEPITVRCTCGLLRPAPTPEKPVDTGGAATTMP